MSDEILHYGIIRRSGRYPWGSGQDPYQRSLGFMDHVELLKKEGLSESDIAKGLLGETKTTNDLRALKTIANAEIKIAEVNWAQRLKDKGMSNVAIGERMGKNESSVRALLAPGAKDKAENLKSISNMLSKEVAERGLIDVGAGVELHLGVSKEKLDVALKILELEEGLSLETIKINQLGTNQQTTTRVLGPKGLTQKDIWLRREEIRPIKEWSVDNGRTFLNLSEPISVDSKRIKVLYGKEGGDLADGAIYIRPGVEDLSLGGGRYAQVRISVDGTHYLKGMAVYKNDLPKGVDIVFASTKSDTGNPKDAMKPLKTTKDGVIDKDNPFGTQISRQIYNDQGKLVSAVNLVNEETDWADWSKSLSSQMLSKQSPTLIRQQLEVTLETKRQKFEEIKNLTNPVVKAKLLESFSDDADAASIHLKAAALPRQKTQVLIPVPSMKNNEVYAPNFRNGERVVLIRFPHGGTFEIPELTVNNKNKEARSILGTNPPDAIGINAHVAERLSGADFDGDTVLVIPQHGEIKTSPPLKGLKDFDPKGTYKLPEGVKFRGNTQELMGNISNLITDMTLYGATDSELARAVRHSMVVIDAEKHGLDHKLSAQVNGIAQLKAKYQGVSESGRLKGASTLLSRKKTEIRVPERMLRRASEGGRIDPKTGELVYTPTNRMIRNRDTGELEIRKERVSLLGVTKDAHDLSSGTTQEKLYADYSNGMKALANEARLEMLATPKVKRDPAAAKLYAKEVEDLTASLRLAEMNAPRERAAQALGNTIVHMKRGENPDMTRAEIKKVKGMALQAARLRIGAKKQRVEISDKQWEAIQAGAVSHDKLERILKNADPDRVVELATPKKEQAVSKAKLSRAKSLLSSGYTQAEVAELLGISVTTISKL